MKYELFIIWRKYIYTLELEERESKERAGNCRRIGGTACACLLFGDIEMEGTKKGSKQQTKNKTSNAKE